MVGEDFEFDRYSCGGDALLTFELLKKHTYGRYVPLEASNGTSGHIGVSLVIQAVINHA